MSRAEREKGLRGEREVAAIYAARGLEVRGLEATGDHLIVGASNAGPTIHSEVKRQETARVWAWWQQASSEAPAGTVPAVHFRRNRSRWLVMLDAETFAGLLAELVHLRDLDVMTAAEVESYRVCDRCRIEWSPEVAPPCCSSCGGELRRGRLEPEPGIA